VRFLEKGRVRVGEERLDFWVSRKCEGGKRLNGKKGGEVGIYNFGRNEKSWS
jgi:hypothetical protein